MFRLLRRIHSKWKNWRLFVIANATHLKGLILAGEAAENGDLCKAKEALSKFEIAEEIFRTIQRLELANVASVQIVSIKWSLRYQFRLDIELPVSSQLLPALDFLSRTDDKQQYANAFATLNMCASMDSECCSREEIHSACKDAHNIIAQFEFLPNMTTTNFSES